MTDREYFRESMQLVVERAKALALRRTLIHSENGSQLDEAIHAAFDFKESMLCIQNLPTVTQEEMDGIQSRLLALAEGDESL